jgi:hypothetical protein
LESIAMTPLRLTLPLTALALGLGCASGTVSGDVYELRLAIENLQDFERQSADNLTSQMSGLRASQSQQIEELNRRLNQLEQAFNELTERLAAQSAAPARHTLVLPPDPESAAARSGVTTVTHTVPAPTAPVTTLPSYQPPAPVAPQQPPSPQPLYLQTPTTPQ